MQLKALIGKKNSQSQVFLENGKRVPVTYVSVAGNFVSQIKTQDKEGYNALQLATGIKKRANKSIVNHSKKAGLTNTARFFKEVRLEDATDLTLGMEINPQEIFEAGDMIDVTGESKGKGWAGGVKRWGFRGGPRTHGQSDRERAPGSIGQTTTPGRVYKGKKMAGRMGSDTVTVKNLEVIEITNDGVLLIKGLVPGSLNEMVIVKKIGKNKNFVPKYKDPSKVEELSAEAVSEVSEPVVEEVKEDVAQEVTTQAPEQAENVEVDTVVKEEVSSDEVKTEEIVDEVKENK